MGWIEGALSNLNTVTERIDAFLGVLEAEMVVEGWELEEVINAGNNVVRVWKSENHTFPDPQPVRVLLCRWNNDTELAVNVMKEKNPAGTQAIGWARASAQGSESVDAEGWTRAWTYSNFSDTNTSTSSSTGRPVRIWGVWSEGFPAASFPYWAKVTRDYVASGVRGQSGFFAGLYESLYPHRSGEFPLGAQTLTVSSGAGSLVKSFGGLGISQCLVRALFQDLGGVVGGEVDPFHQGITASRVMFSNDTFAPLRVMIPDIVQVRTASSNVNVGDRIWIDGGRFSYIGNTLWMRSD